LAAAEEVRSMRPRLQGLVLVAGVVFVGLLARLFQLQILEGEHFARKAERNFVDTIDVEAPRGRIFDAKGRALATNRPAYTLYVTARPRLIGEDSESGEQAGRRVPVTDAQIEDLCRLIDFADDADREDFVGRIRTLRVDEANGRYPVAVRSNLTWEENARILTRERLDDWVEIRESARRFYPEAELAAFVTGYMREISPDELAASPHAGYRPGERVGKTGIERQWENYLRGRLGSRSRVVNSRGRAVTDPPRDALAALPAAREPIPGQDIYLSLDTDLQRVAAEAFDLRVAADLATGQDEHEGLRAGGLVAMEIHTGRILAMLSAPAVDPNRWEQPITRDEYSAWLESPFKPFVDKTVQENYFPGSTYKVVSALAMLADPRFDPEQEVECKGYVDYGNRRFRDAHRHGVVSLHQAIVQSCNVYFFHLAADPDKDLTLSKMEDMARRLGLGERTGLGINGETRGIIPTEASESRQGTFQKGVRLNSAIGQGNVKSSVLQIAVLYAAIANGGYVLTPSLVDRIETFDGRVVLETSPQYKTHVPVIDRRARDRIHQGLVGVVNDERGTAYSERLTSVLVAGKTGTAQVGIERRRADLDAEIAGWDTTKDHAWFAAYAPADDPKIVVAALVVHGGAGADAAAPIAMRVMDYYLGGGGSQEKPSLRAPGVPPPLPGERERARTREGADR
jgi:penicillin-binding protein 2